MELHAGTIAGGATVRVSCISVAAVFLLLGCSKTEPGMWGEVWERVEQPREASQDWASESVNPYTDTRSTTTPWGTIPVVAYDFDARTGMGKLSVDIAGKGIEVRSWVIENIGEICSSHNIVLEAGREPIKGGRYEILRESVVDGILTIDFKALY